MVYPLFNKPCSHSVTIVEVVCIIYKHTHMYCVCVYMSLVRRYVSNSFNLIVSHNITVSFILDTWDKANWESQLKGIRCTNLLLNYNTWVCHIHTGMDPLAKIKLVESLCKILETVGVLDTTPAQVCTYMYWLGQKRICRREEVDSVAWWNLALIKGTSK